MKSVRAGARLKRQSSDGKCRQPNGILKGLGDGGPGEGRSCRKVLPLEMHFHRNMEGMTTWIWLNGYKFRLVRSPWTWC